MTDIFELTLDTSSGNLSDMANAMVNSDSFKASHPNLMDWMEEQHRHQQERLERLDAGETSPSSSDKNLNKNQSSSGSGGGGILVRSNSPNKRSQSSLRFQEPPKRRKLDPNLTVKRLVRGTCHKWHCLFDLWLTFLCITRVRYRSWRDQQNLSTHLRPPRFYYCPRHYNPQKYVPVPQGTTVRKSSLEQKTFWITRRNRVTMTRLLKASMWLLSSSWFCSCLNYRGAAPTLSLVSTNPTWNS